MRTTMTTTLSTKSGTEQIQKKYWAVWVRSTTTNEWFHHQSLDTRDDARDEARRLRDQGDKVLIRRQDW